MEQYEQRAEPWSETLHVLMAPSEATTRNVGLSPAGSKLGGLTAPDKG